MGTKFGGAMPAMPEMQQTYPSRVVHLAATSNLGHSEPQPQPEP